MRFIKAIGISLLGVLIVFAGVVFDFMFVGIPYQDPPPELLADYNFHSAIANLIYKAGGTVFLLGLVAIPFVWKMAKGKKRD